MRGLLRDMSAFYYCLYLGCEEEVDEYGGGTGIYRPLYSEPVKILANVSSVTGQAAIHTGRAVLEDFGILERYDRTIKTHDMACPIDEQTVLFLEKEPEYDADGNPLYDYVVKRVKKTPNVIAIAASKARTEEFAG